MKKITTFLLVFTMAISLAACQNQDNDSTGNNNTAPVRETQTPSESESTTEKPEENNHVLTAYFSLWGNSEYPDDIDATTSASIVVDANERYGTTEYVAEMIRENVGGDIYPIQTAEPYPADF